MTVINAQLPGVSFSLNNRQTPHRSSRDRTDGYRRPGVNADVGFREDSEEQDCSRSDLVREIADSERNKPWPPGATDDGTLL
jgi:hypothetical protein